MAIVTIVQTCPNIKVIESVKSDFNTISISDS